jgi:hypothetical protein
MAKDKNDNIAVTENMLYHITEQSLIFVEFWV